MRTGSSLVWTMDVGTGKAVAVNDDAHPIQAFLWSPDGKYLLLNSGGVLLVVPLTGTDPLARKAIEFARDEFDKTVGRFSPDGKFIAYRSDEANPLKGEVYVRQFDAATGLPGDGKWQVSKDA